MLLQGMKVEVWAMTRTSNCYSEPNTQLLCNKSAFTDIELPVSIHRLRPGKLQTELIGILFP